MDKINDESALELLNFLASQGKINLGDVQNEMARSRERDVVNRSHPYKIYQGTDNRWYTYIPDESKKNGRKKIAKSTEEQLMKTLYNFYTGQEIDSKVKKVTLRTLYPQWIEYKALLTDAETYITRIESDWKKYYLDSELIDIPITELDKITLSKWVHQIIKAHKMTKTQYYNVTVIVRQALTYAVDLKLIPQSPMDEVVVNGKKLFRKVKKKASETQVFTKEELSSLKKLAWKDFKDGNLKYELAPLAVLFQFQTGLRISEVSAVRYEDIESENFICIQRMVRRDTKEVVEYTKGTYGDRNVFLTTEAKHIIECAKQRQKELGVDSTGFIFSTNEEALKHTAIADLFTKYCKKIGSIHKSSHKARKTYISTLIDGGVNINTIREAVGHTDERTTYANYCFDRKTVEEKNILIENALLDKTSSLYS